MIEPYRLTWAEKSALFGAFGYKPNEPEQANPHKSQARVLLVAGAERGGKSRWAAAEVSALALGWDVLIWRHAIQVGKAKESDRRPLRVAVAGGSYDETRPEMEYVIADLRGAGVTLDSCSTPKTGKWEVGSKQLNVEIETVSLKDGPGS